VLAVYLVSFVHPLVWQRGNYSSERKIGIDSGSFFVIRTKNRTPAMLVGGEILTFQTVEERTFIGIRYLHDQDVSSSGRVWGDTYWFIVPLHPMALIAAPIVLAALIRKRSDWSRRGRRGFPPVMRTPS
jgi:hypothetical protein